MTLNMQVPIIGLTGKAGAGKDTVANYACSLLLERGISANKIACADKLKSVCFDLFGTAFGVSSEAFYGSQIEKETLLEAVPGWSGRRILQFVGTECFRSIHPLVWSTYVVNQAKINLANGYKAVFISDVRFLTESKAIHEAGGIVIRVKRPEADERHSTHASETELLQIKEDYVIDNGGRELYLLKELVREFLCQLNF